MLRLITTVTFICAGIATVAAQEFEPVKPAEEHALLKQFAGEWVCENELLGAPGQPSENWKGTMSGRMIGEFWAVVELRIDEAPEPMYIGQGTFGFDALKSKKYYGTWTDAMSPFLWKYEGVADGNKLSLNSEGPHPGEPGKIVKARDTWEFKNKDLIVLSSEIEGPDGKMIPLMKATCTRKK